MEFGIFDHLDRGRDAAIGDIYEDRLKLIEGYEAAGFHAYHLAEHHATPLGMAPSPGLFLACVAQRTRRILFGPLVYILPLYDPLRLVEEICMLDHLSGGRFQLGVGRGISAFEVAYFGVPHLESQAMYEEAYRVVMAGLANDVLTHRGAYYNYSGVPPLQTPHPPLWYGAGNPASGEWAARNRVNIVMNTPCGVARPITDRYREVWQAENGAAEMPKMGVARQLYVAETDEEARTRGKPAFDSWFDSFAKLWRKFGANPIRYPNDFETACRVDQVVVGSPATVRENIERQMAESGCNYFVCRLAYGDLTYEESARSLELFANEVMPHFR